VIGNRHLAILGVLALALASSPAAHSVDASADSTRDHTEADGDAGSADPITEIHLALRGVGAASDATAVQIELLREGELLVSRTSGVATGPGARHSLALRLPEPLPISDCVDLEIDIRLGSGEKWSFTIESIELRTRSGRRLRDVFAFDHAATQRGAAAPGVIALDPSRRGITLQPGSRGCP
jgi:hypothetical protein